MLLNRFVHLPQSVLPEYVTLARRKVKWARIEVHSDGQVLLVVPRFTRQSEINSFFWRKLAWVEKKRSLYARRAAQQSIQKHPLLFGEVFQFRCDTALASTMVDIKSRRIVSPKDLSIPAERSKWYRQYSKEYLSNRINEISLDSEFEFNKIYIRDQKTRWGSCSDKKIYRLTGG